MVQRKLVRRRARSEPDNRAREHDRQNCPRSEKGLKSAIGVRNRSGQLITDIREEPDPSRARQRQETAMKKRVVIDDQVASSDTGTRSPQKPTSRLTASHRSYSMPNH